jgi:hypothetical protein
MLLFLAPRQSRKPPEFGFLPASQPQLFGSYRTPFGKTIGTAAMPKYAWF